MKDNKEKYKLFNRSFYVSQETMKNFNAVRAIMGNLTTNEALSEIVNDYKKNHNLKF